MNLPEGLIRLGQILKAKREEKNMSLKQISKETKISVSLLQALEEGETERLPTYVYLRGFILAYSQVLQIKKEEILNELKVLFPVAQQKSEVGATPSLDDEIVEKDLRLTQIVSAIFILFILSGILIFANMIRNYDKLDKIIVEKEKSVNTAVDSSENKKEKAKKEIPRKLNSKITELKKTMVDNSAPIKKTSVEIVVRAIRNVKFSYRVDELEDQEFLLKRDQFKILKAEKNILVRSESPQWIQIFQDGKDLGLLGKKQSQKQRVFSVGGK